MAVTLTIFIDTSFPGDDVTQDGTRDPLERRRLALILSPNVIDAVVRQPHSRSLFSGRVPGAAWRRRRHVSRTGHSLRSLTLSRHSHGGGEPHGHNGWTGPVSEQSQSLP